MIGTEMLRLVVVSLAAAWCSGLSAPQAWQTHAESWIELAFACEPSVVSAAELSACLLELGAASVTASDAAASVLQGEDEYDVFNEPAWRSSQLWAKPMVRAIVSADVAGDVANGAMEIFGVSVAERRALDPSVDWLKAQEDSRPPVVIGNMRIILPWHENSADAVRLEGGTAFGTGEHPTTRMCVLWLQRHLPAFATVLDYGCGSGILALVALKAGASHAVGVDADVDAVRAADRNARANGFSPAEAHFSLPLSAREAHPQQTFDVVVANLFLGRPPQPRLYPSGTRSSERPARRFGCPPRAASSIYRGVRVFFWASRRRR